MRACLLCNSSLRNEMPLADLIRLTPLVKSTICEDCSNGFVDLSSSPTCSVCGRKRREGMPDPCHDCQRWANASEVSFVNTALYEYNPFMKDFMKRYKFNGDYRLRKVFSGQIRQQLRKTQEVLVPIPVSLDTIATRGFNQVTGLLENLGYADVLKVKVEKKAVRQSEKNRRDRIALNQPFEFNESEKNSIQNKAVLIVDDVYTTGTTIRHAATLLYGAGATSVRGFTLAR